MTRLRIALIALPFIPVALGVASIAVMLNDNVPPYVHDYGTIFPENPREESQVTIDWKMKIVNRICPGWVQRQIYDRTGALACNYDLQPAIRREQLKSTRADGIPNTLDRSFMLCPAAKAGPATYRAYTCYQCNLLQEMYPSRSICMYTPDVSFTIAPKDK